LKLELSTCIDAAAVNSQARPELRKKKKC